MLTDPHGERRNKGLTKLDKLTWIITGEKIRGLLYAENNDDS